MKIQTYLIKELAEIENVGKPTIHSWIEKWIFLPVIFRRGMIDRRESVRYLSREMSALMRKAKNVEEIFESELEVVENLEKERRKLEATKVRKPRKWFTS